MLPASIRIRLHDIADYRQVEFQLAGEAPVRRVRSLGERIDELSAVSNVLNGLGLVASLVFGVSAVVLIANTIRMAIYARRDEVSIMKLVGAGNWFIRVPFVLEGLIEGVVGAGLAVLAVWLASDRLASVEQSVEIVRLSLPTDFFLRWGVVVRPLRGCGRRARQPARPAALPQGLAVRRLVAALLSALALIGALPAPAAGPKEELSDVERRIEELADDIESSRAAKGSAAAHGCSSRRPHWRRAEPPLPPVRRR